MNSKHFLIAFILFSFFLVAQDETPETNNMTVFQKKFQQLMQEHFQKLKELKKKHGVPMMVQTPPPTLPKNLLNNALAFWQHSEELPWEDQFEKKKITYDEYIQKRRNLAQRFKVEDYIPPMLPEKELKKWIPLAREGRKLGEEFQDNLEKLRRKYGIQNAMQEKPGRNAHGFIYKGLNIPEGSGIISSADQLFYKKDTSKEWQKIISRVHKKDERLQFVKNVTGWSGVGKTDKTFPFIVSPAVVQLETPLNPALVKVFSQPEKYLTPEWNTTMVGEILIVPKGITQNAPFPIPSAQQIPQLEKQKERGELPKYRFFIPHGLEEKEIITLMKQLQNDISVDEGKLTQGVAIERARALEEALRGGEPNASIFASCPATNVEERVDVDVDSLISKLKEETDWSKRQEILNELIAIGSNDVIEKLKMLLFDSEDRSLQAQVFYALGSILYRKDPAQYLDLIENERVKSNPNLLTNTFYYLGSMYSQNPQLHSRISRVLLDYLNNENTYLRTAAIESLLETHDDQLVRTALREAESILAQPDKEQDSWNMSPIKNDLANTLLFEVHMYIQQSQWMSEANDGHIDSMLKIITDPQNIQFLGVNAPTMLSIIGYVKDHPSLSHYAAPLQEYLDKMKSPDYR